MSAMKSDEELDTLDIHGNGGNDEEHVVLTPDLLSPESCSRRDEAPLLASTGVLEIATESFEQNQHEFRQATVLQRLCTKEGRLHVCGVFSLVVCGFIVVFSWLGTQVSGVDDATETLANAHTPTASHGTAFATTSSVTSKLVFRYPEDGSTEDHVRRLTVESAVNITLSPQEVSDSIMIQIPQAVHSTLKRLQVVGMDISCNRKGTMCLCQTAALNNTSLSADVSAPFSDCRADCSYVLQQSPLPPSMAYSYSDWYQLLVPCTLQPDMQYILEVLSAPEGAFMPSDPYVVPKESSTSVEDAESVPDEGSETLESSGSEESSGSTRRLQKDSSSAPSGDDEVNSNRTRTEQAVEPEQLETGMLGSAKRFEPSTLASGSYTAFHRLIVTLPAGLKALSSVEEEHSESLADGSTRVTFKELQGWSLNMLAVAVGRFDNLASGLDSEGRRVGVWALPGGLEADAQLTMHVLNASISAWSDFTGHAIPELGKLDMVVWNGASPWSSSQFGLLYMDRFRTLWNPEFSTASDLIRAAHITCHEAGHNWWGGVLQTLNQTAFIEESTTSYSEVFCVSKVLPKSLGNVLTIQRAFFPEFDDTRSIHVGGEFHAIDNLATPKHAQDTVVSSSAAFYTKGATLLHMLESYADSSVKEGLMGQVIKDLFEQFQHQAVSQDTLLCLVSVAFSGCRVEQLSGIENSCSSALSSVIPALEEEDDDSGETDSNTDAAAVDAAESCGELVDRWMQRLHTWVFEPGLQQVELHVSSTDDPANNSSAIQTYQAQLLPNSLPGQGDSDTPVWIPVSMMATSETTATTSSNSSDALFESRWMEIFPVWEEQHRVAAGSEAMCREATEDPDDACSRPIASPPVIIDNGTVPWIMKGDPGMFLSSISHEDDGQAHKSKLASVLRHLRLNLKDEYEVDSDDPNMKLVQAFTSLIHDQRILFKRQPTTDGYAFLKLLVEAAFKARATSQAGVVSYSLLGAATSAVQEFFQLARGNETCFDALVQWENATVTHRGTTLWPRARSNSKDDTGFADLTQDMVFSRIAAVHVVPRAVRYDENLAAGVCGELPAEALDPDQLREAYRSMPYAPDVKNIVLETAIVTNAACKDAAGLESSIVSYLQQSAEENGLLPHLQRSLVFMLGSSANSTTLRWLVDTVVLGDPKSKYGLREVDKHTLMKRIVRSPAGFEASVDAFQTQAANQTESEWDRKGLLVQLSGLVSAAASKSLPEWLPDAIPDATMEVLQLEKDSDQIASAIVCS